MVEVTGVGENEVGGVLGKGEWTRPLEDVRQSPDGGDGELVNTGEFSKLSASAALPCDWALRAEWCAYAANETNGRSKWTRNRKLDGARLVGVEFYGTWLDASSLVSIHVGPQETATDEKNTHQILV
jgi:hypothetical protein